MCELISVYPVNCAILWKQLSRKRFVRTNGEQATPLQVDEGRERVLAPSMLQGPFVLKISPRRIIL
jgi:hypothetical protein